MNAHYSHALWRAYGFLVCLSIFPLWFSIAYVIHQRLIAGKDMMDDLSWEHAKACVLALVITVAIVALLLHVPLVGPVLDKAIDRA